SSSQVPAGCRNPIDIECPAERDCSSGAGDVDDADAGKPRLAGVGDVVINRDAAEQHEPPAVEGDRTGSRGERTIGGHLEDAAVDVGGAGVVVGTICQDEAAADAGDAATALGQADAAGDLRVDRHVAAGGHVVVD